MARLAASADAIRDADRSGKRRASFPRGDDDLCDKIKAYLEFRSRRVDPPASLAEIWDRFYDFYTPRIRAYLRRSRLPEADREDCLQDIWREVVAHLGHLDYDPGRGPLSNWLMIVARNTAVDAIRRGQHRSAGRIEDAASLRDSFLCPPDACERLSTQARVRSVLTELSAQVSAVNFQVFYQRGIEGLTNGEVAEKLGLKPEQVRFRLHRMKRKFRELFERSPDSGPREARGGRPRGPSVKHRGPRATRRAVVRIK